MDDLKSILCLVYGQKYDINDTCFFVQYYKISIIRSKYNAHKNLQVEMLLSFINCCLLSITVKISTSVWPQDQITCGICMYSFHNMVTIFTLKTLIVYICRCIKTLSSSIDVRKYIIELSMFLNAYCTIRLNNLILW